MNGQSKGSVGIRGEHIAGIYEPGSEAPASETIDAAGLTLIPGCIDMHSHHREGAEKGYEYKETIETATRQCAAGGITTSVGMPNVVPPPNSVTRMNAQWAVYAKSSIVDYNFNPAATVLEEIPKLAKQRIAAFKIFMVVDTGRDYPHMPGIGVHDHGEIMAIMEACAEAKVPLMVHPHNQALMDHIEKGYWARGERDALAYARAYASNDGVIWDTAIQTLLRLQRATGVHLHLLHLQTSGSVEMVREAKRRGQNVTVEVNPWALFLGCDWSAIERLGSYALSYYVPEKNLPILWDAVNDGTIDILASDHAPHTREEKEIGWTDGWKAHTGTPSAQYYLSLLLDAVAEGRTTLERVVRITSYRPAEIFGLQGKGRIQVGHDADLVLVDLNAEKEIRDEDTLGLIGWTPYAGRKVRGLPVRTIVRGRTVYVDGKVVGTPGFGKQARAVYPGQTAPA
ncbi:MAG: dihydroorotase family protein [Variovorax sp.]